MISSCISSITSPKISKLIMLTNKLISTAITLRDTLARVHTYFWLLNRDKELMGKLPLVTAHLFQRFILLTSRKLLTCQVRLTAASTPDA